MSEFIDSIRQHLVGVLLTVSFGAWSLALWQTQHVVGQYLDTQSRIETKLLSIENQVRDGFSARDREVEIIKERQNSNTSARMDMEMRLRALEAK